MADSKLFAIGCFTFLYAMGMLFLSVAWFGLPWGQHHGLDVVFARDLVHTTGKVVRFESFSMTRGQTSTPIVEIQLPNGPFRFCGEGEDQHPFDKGDEVPVAYPSGHPERATIRTFRQMYFGPLLMILFASPFLAMALVGTYRNVRARREGPQPYSPS